MFSLDYRDSRPIYLQVKDSLYHLMLSGALTQGDQLPSVRSLASDLAINPNTIARAYEALEQEKLIYTVKGKGSFVAPMANITKQRKDELMIDFQKILGDLFRFGATESELCEEVHRFATLVPSEAPKNQHPPAPPAQENQGQQAHEKEETHEH